MAIDPKEIQLTEEQKEELARLAEKAGKAWEEVLSAALQGFQRQERAREGGRGQSLYDALHQDGLIGVVKDGPPDLSTNPKHLEGFGTE